MLGLVIVLLMPCVSNGEAPHTTSQPLMILDVLLVNDADFPPVKRAHAAWILAEARNVLADKLGFDSIRFNVKDSVDVKAFIERNTLPDDPCLKQLTPDRVGPKQQSPQEIPTDKIQRFLKRWKLDELRAYFPEDQRNKLTDYQKVSAALIDEFARKLATIAAIHLGNGESLLSPEKIEQRSYVRWICAMRHQDEADLILTNAFILYDLGAEPYPHSIFAKNKVGGASLKSTKRQAIRGRAVVASTFSMVTDLPFFREEGADKLTAGQRLSVIGTFIVAHELGHAIFKIPDFYNHPKECLMTTQYETGYVSGYRDVLQNPGECSQCLPYVQARRLVFLATVARTEGRYKEAIDFLKEAIKTTPKHIDGDYRYYVADLSLDVAETYLAMGNVVQSKRWLTSVQRITKNFERADALQARLNAL
ncbi:MAG: tetratricopeptide repeat protein [Myxococcota bacterium]